MVLGRDKAAVIKVRWLQKPCLVCAVSTTSRYVYKAECTYSGVMTMAVPEM